MSRNHGVGTVAAALTVALVGVSAACSERDEGTPRTDQPVVVASAGLDSPAVPVTMTSVPPVAESAIVRRTGTYAEGESAFRRGRYAEAAELFEGVVVAQPGSGQSHYMLGLSAWKSGDHDRAEAALARAVELDGESVKARTNLSRVQLEQGRAADALLHIEPALELAPDSHEVWRVYGNVLSELDRSDDALDAYRQAIVLNGDDAWSMNNYGLVLIRQGRYEEALQPLARAVQLAPASAVFQNNLGVALERSGRPVSARSAFTAAIEADSTYTKAQASLERLEALAQHGSDDFGMAEYADRFMQQVAEWRATEHGC